MITKVRKSFRPVFFLLLPPLTEDHSLQLIDFPVHPQSQDKLPLGTIIKITSLNLAQTSKATAH